MLLGLIAFFLESGWSDDQGRSSFSDSGIMMKKELTTVVAEYELGNEIAENYAYQLSYAANRLGIHLGRIATTDDLTKKTINGWLLAESKCEKPLSPRSRKNLRTSILTIWKFAQRSTLDRDMIRSVTVPARNPEAWTFEEFQSVANAADHLEGIFKNGVPRSLYMRCCLWFVYETGLRRGDVWSFDFQQFDSDRKAAFTQQKTEDSHLIKISKATESDLRKIVRILKQLNDPDHNKPLRWSLGNKQFYYWMRKCRQIARVEPDVWNRSLQHGRRTGATQVAIDGNPSWVWLGHKRPGIHLASYEDRRKVCEPVMPSRQRVG